MTEVLTLIRAAQREHARLVIELDKDGKFRVVVNEAAQAIDQTEDIRL